MAWYIQDADGQSLAVGAENEIKEICTLINCFGDAKFLWEFISEGGDPEGVDFVAARILAIDGDKP